MSPQLKDTLEQYGVAFQNKTLAALMSDESFVQRVIDIVYADFFESVHSKWTVEQFIKYYRTYGQAPTIEALTVIAKKEITNDKQVKALLEHLEVIFDTMRAKDLEFVKEEFLTFCKNQKMKSAIMDSVDLLKRGQYGAIQEIMNDALNAGEETRLGHDYKEEIEIRLTKETRNVVSTGIAHLDDIMQGGLAAGELGCIIGTAGGGKSWSLAALGVAALKSGKNVVHYTLELNDLYTAHRYDTVLTGITLSELHLPEHKETIMDAVKRLPGKLLVTQYPTKFATPFTILNHAKRLKTLGYQIDMIILDYADLLTSAHGKSSDNMYETSGTIYEQLRGVAGELKVPLWTVSQAQRASLNDDIIEADKIAESYKKVMTADFVGSISRKTEDKLKKTARFHVIKNRFGPDGLTFPMKLDTDTGVIELYDPKMTENEAERMKERVKNLSNADDFRKDLKTRFSDILG